MSEDRLRSSHKIGLTLGDFEVEGVLGEGSFGLVLLASRNGEELALKEMSKHRLKKVHSEHIALIEKELARSMKHPGVVSGTSAFQSSSKLYLVLEYCGGGEFQQYAVRGMREESRRFYFAELINIVEYLQRAGIVHRDIKPANLLLTQEGHLKMIDFGTACLDQCTLVSPVFLQALESMKLEKEGQDLPGPTPRIRKRKSTFVGTSQYMPPELIVENSCGPASDLWALGCILYFLYYGQCPFEDPCELVVFQKIKGGKFSFPEKEEISSEVKDLISQLLRTNPSERLGSGHREDLSFKALKEHPFFYGLDIDNIFSTKPPNFVSPEAEISHRISVLQKQNDHSADNNSLVLFLARKVHHIYIVFKCVFQEGLYLRQYEVQGLSKQPITSRLNPIHSSEIAKCLTTKKLLIRTRNEQGFEEKLFFWTHSADDYTKKINEFYSSGLRETDLEEI